MFNKLFKISYTILIALYLFSIFQTNKLPGKNEINKNLFLDPIQTKSNNEDFDFDYRGKNYKVHPLADYELWGLVVSVNNINAWYNYYHDENAVNLKDVCVIWGDNISNEIYLHPNTKIKNGEWTCYYQWQTKNGSKIFPNKLSNNHLLTADEEIQEIIRNIHKGDQIHLKGFLVDYAEGSSDWYRKTSLSRSDSNQTSRSGGACEIVYTNEIELLKQNQNFFYLIKKWSKNIFFSLFLIQFLLSLKSIFSNKSLFKQNF